MQIKIVFISVIAFGTISAQTILKKGLLLLGGIDFSYGVVVEILRIMHSPTQWRLVQPGREYY